jgi:hypothetical protein
MRCAYCALRGLTSRIGIVDGGRKIGPLVPESTHRPEEYREWNENDHQHLEQAVGIVKLSARRYD